MAATRTKVLRVGFVTPPRNLEPLTANDVESAFVLRHVLETPFDLAYGSADIEPWLFHGPLRRRGGGDDCEGDLRPGLMFSDGTPVRAADVVRCLSRAARVGAQAEVRAEGEALIVFHMKRPNARLDLTLSHMECGIHKRVGGQLIGSGAYMLAPESSPDFVRLVRNPHYRRAFPIDEVHLRTYPADSDGRASALLAAIAAGEVDLSLSLGRQDVEVASGVRKVIQPGVSTALLFFNCKSPHLSHPRLRAALARAIDRFEITRLSYSNPLAFVASSVTPKPLGPLDDDLGYDLMAARALLAGAGVPVPARLSLMTTWAPRPYLPHPAKAARLIAQQLALLGIAVDIHEPPSSTDFFKASVAGRHDLVLGGWVADTMDPYDFIESLLSSERVPRNDNLAVASNHAHFESVAMDVALERFRAERQNEHLETVLQIFNEQAPMVPLMYGPAASVRSYRVANFKTSPRWFVPAWELDLEG